MKEENYQAISYINAYYFIITYFKKITAAVTNVNCNSGTITSCWWHHASDGRDCFMMILCCIYDSPVDRLLFINTINHWYYIYCGKSIVSIDYIHICSKTAEKSRFRGGNLWRGNICADRKIISVYFWCQIMSFWIVTPYKERGQLQMPKYQLRLVILQPLF